MVVARIGTPYVPQNPLLARVTRAQAGDAPAFTELVRDHQNAVYSLVLGIVRNTEDAGDIVQDVWMKVARALPQLREPERFVPWLYRIARNCSMDFCNSRKKRPQTAYRRDDEHEDEAFDVPDSSTYVPEQELLSLDERRKVWEALGALSEADRTVLFLRESRELPYAEIARILGISCNAAEVRVFRARERFRKQFIEVEEAAPECNVSPLQLGAYVDGELGDATQKMLERHIHSCAECTSRLTAIESGRTLYRGLGLFLMPSGLITGLLSNLATLGVASAATAAAGTGIVAVGAGGAAAGGAAAGGAASGAAAGGTMATGTVAATAAAATGVAATSTTFGAGIAAAVAAVAVTGTVAVEYTDTSAAAQLTPPPAAVLEIAAPPSPPVTIVITEPSALSAPQAQVVETAAPPKPAVSVVTPSTESSDDSSSASTGVAGGTSGTSQRGGGESDGRGSDTRSPEGRAADRTGSGRSSDGKATGASGGVERGNAAAVIAAFSRDDRSGRDSKADTKDARNDAKSDAKGDKSDGGRASSSAAATIASMFSDAGRGNDARGNDGGRGNDARGNDNARDNGRDDGGRGRDDGGRGHDGGGRGR